MDFWKEFFFNNAIGVVLGSVKDPATQAKFRRAFLKVFKIIWQSFQHDQEFRDAVGLEAE